MGRFPLIADTVLRSEERVPVYVLLIIPACFVLAVVWVLWRGRPARRLGDAASVSEHARRMQALAPPSTERRRRRQLDR